MNLLIWLRAYQIILSKMKFLLFLTLIVFSSCKKEKVNYIHLKTIVDSTELRHSGKGYYNEWGFYEFTYKNKKYLKF